MTNDEKAARDGAILGVVVVVVIVLIAAFGVYMMVTEDGRTEIQRYQYTEIDRMVNEYPTLSGVARSYAQKGWVSKKDFANLEKQYEQLQFEKQKKELFQKLEVK